MSDNTTEYKNDIGLHSELHSDIRNTDRIYAKTIDQNTIQRLFLSSHLIIPDLGRQVIPDMPLIKLIRHEQRHIVAHHQLHLVRQARRLAEVDEVLEREGERDVLVHLDEDARDVVRVGRVFLRLGGFGFLGGFGGGALERAS